MPRLFELRGSSEGPWVLVLANLSTAAALFAMTLVLIQVTHKRKFPELRWVILLIETFFWTRGVTQLLAIWTIFHPAYGLSWELRVGTAAFGVITAAALIRLLPVLDRIPSNADLNKEVVERRRAEETAREKEARYQSFVDSIQDYAIYILDPRGFVQTWNPGAERIKGYTSEEIIGQHFSRFFTLEEIAREEPEEALRTARDMGRFESECWRLRKDGSRFWANVILHPLRDNSGALVGYSKLTRDLTESRAMEARFKTLLEATPDAILIVDRLGLIQFANHRAESLFGYARSEFAGKSFEELIPARFRGHRGSLREVFFDSPRDREMGEDRELWGLRKDGSEFSMEFSLSPLETAEGRVVLAAVRDVTEHRKIEVRFRALVEFAPDAMVIVSSGGRIELANRQTEKIFGYARTEMVGKSVDMLIPPELLTAHEQHREDFFRAPQQREMGIGLDLMAVRKDGSQFPVEISLSPVEGPDGTSVTAAIRDITERKKTETRFRDMLEAAPDAVIICGKPDRIVYVNRRAEHLFGRDRAELLGQSADILLPERMRVERSLDRERFFDSPTNLGMGLNGERICMRKDGTEFGVEATTSPIETPEGPAFLAFIRDNTEKKNTEARFRALLDSAPDAMVIVKPDGLIELANIRTEEMFGYSRTEIVGQSVDILMQESLRPAHQGHRSDFFRAPQQREMGAGLDLMARRKDGTEFPVEISLSPVEGPDGISVTAAVRDVTGRKLAAAHLTEKNSELRRSNEALEQFAHIASHDLQEPLRMVASYTQLLSRRYTGRLDSDADEFIAYAVDGTQRMKRLINDLLLYSRSGVGAPPVRELKSQEVLKLALDNLKTAIEESHAVVTFDSLPTLVAADSQLVRVFQNLIGNAIKYRGDQVPSIHISAHQRSREWIFSVSDNGIGIDPKYFDRIFLIFQRLHGREEYEGTGIGLAICVRILQQQGGRIWVESEPGHGSTFHFALPTR